MCGCNSLYVRCHNKVGVGLGNIITIRRGMYDIHRLRRFRVGVRVGVRAGEIPYHTRTGRKRFLSGWCISA